MSPVSDFGWQAEYILKQMTKLEQLSKEDDLASHLFKLSCRRAREGDWEGASKSFEQCLNLSEDPRDDKVRGAALVGLGAIHLCRGNPTYAVEYYLRAARLFDDVGESYSRAVVLLGLALIYQVQKGWREVFRYYQESLELVRDQSDQLSQQLQKEILQRFQEAFQEYDHGSPGGTTISPESEPAPAYSHKDQLSHRLLFMPIIGKIAAGKPVPTQEDIRNYVVADNVHIDGADYAIRVLGEGSGQELKLQMEYRYFVMQIQGDSMIDAGILEGDYVILKQPRSVPPRADDGDIVAATITGMESEATLKRFHRRGKNRIILQPENPIYQPLEFNEGDRTIEIVGVAVAVLKRLKPELDSSLKQLR